MYFALFPKIIFAWIIFFNIILGFMPSFTAHAIDQARDRPCVERVGARFACRRVAIVVTWKSWTNRPQTINAAKSLVAHYDQDATTATPPTPDHSYPPLQHSCVTSSLMAKCKILLPKFNTWKPVHLERENSSKVPLCQHNQSVFGQKPLPLQCNRVAISP